MIFQIISWVIVLVPTICILLAMVLRSRKGGIAVQGFRTFLHLIAIVASFFIARALAPVVSKALLGNDFILSGLEGAIASFLPQDAVASFVEQLTVGLAAPVLYLGVLIVLEILLWILSAFLVPLIKKSVSSRSWSVSLALVSKISAVVLAIVTALAVSAFALMPVTGLVGTLSSVSKSLDDADVEGADNPLAFSEELSSPGMTVINAFTGFVYDPLTECTIEGMTISISKDVPPAIPLLKDCVGQMQGMIDEMFSEDFKDADLSVISSVGKEIEPSDPAKIVFSAVMKGFAEAAEAGSSFLGIDFSETEGDSTLKTLKVALTAAFAETSPFTVSEDMQLFESAASTLQNTLKALESMNLGDKAASLEFFKRAFENMTPESADLAGEIITGSLDMVAEQIGDQMTGVTAFIRDIYLAMGTARAEGTVSEQKFSEEVIIFNNLLTAAVSPGLENIDTMVKSYSYSDVISSVVMEMVKTGNDPLGIASSLNDEAKARLTAMVNECKENGANAEKLDALLPFFGLEK